MGNVKGIPPGDIQRMSAGTGVMHSEFNHAKDQETHLLQIWIEPSVNEISPSYEQITIPTEEKRKTLRLVASPTGEQGSVTIYADAKMYAGLFDQGDSYQQILNPQRKAYLHLVRGNITVNGHPIKGGDAVLMDGESELQLSNPEDAEVIFFDLAP
jgi:redox-sensitive bicupin YhaK (pirin superfamily)